MKSIHRKTHEVENVSHSTARYASTPRFKVAAKKVADYVVVLFK